MDNDDIHSSNLSSMCPFDIVEKNCTAGLETKDDLTCKVCGDAALGKHYGVVTCEGCKGFFKRTIQLNLVYNCKRKSSEKFVKPCEEAFKNEEGASSSNNCNNSRCIIDKETRNDCQKCRFDICIEVGMNQFLIRSDGAPGGKRKRSMNDCISCDVLTKKNSDFISDSSLQKSVEPNYSLLSILTNIGADKMPGEKCPELPASVPLPSSVSVELSNFFLCGYEELEDVIVWAKKLPFFDKIHNEDQMIVLKSCFLDIITFRLAYRSVGYEDKICFAIGHCYNSEEAAKLGLKKDLFDLTSSYVDRLREIDLDLTEFCTISAIILTFGKSNAAAVNHTLLEMQAVLMKCLNQYVKATYPTDRRRYCKLIQLLSSLKGLSIKAMDSFLSMAIAGKIPMSDLISDFVS